DLEPVDPAVAETATHLDDRRQRTRGVTGGEHRGDVEVVDLRQVDFVRAGPGVELVVVNLDVVDVIDTGDVGDVVDCGDVSDELRIAEDGAADDMGARLGNRRDRVLARDRAGDVA